MNRTEFIGTDLYYSQDFVEEKDKEIERLKEELKYTIPIVEHNKTITKHLKEIEKLKEEKESWKRVATKNFNEAEDYKSIIKEVREYIENEDNQTKRGIYPNYWYEVKEKDILEILDKGE